ncbi:hypothetical protein D9619_004198 [Psilocybe cf. subviscida]|uniref:Protein kinase domain-containing protein n=1 Tax=Psilocybe cf. subviscida TaxID=2480587 RepID=A0A8H5BSB3_9AGAR|nr:hypothetical protein D9619_004198 [Psilocybe cf. subviscida]
MEIHKEDPRELMWTLDYPVLTAIISKDMCEGAASLPRYITTACDSLKNLYTQSDEENPEPHAKLFDFGSVRREGDATKGLQCMPLSRSPEIVYALEVEKIDNPQIERPSDIWALGTVIISGGTLSMLRDYVSLSKIASFAGDPPPMLGRLGI